MTWNKTDQDVTIGKRRHGKQRDGKGWDAVSIEKEDGTENNNTR